jgi:hypothetical protein
VFVIVLCVVKGGFCGRQGEDQPAVSGVDGGESEDIAEKSAVGFWIFAVEDDVCAVDHEVVRFVRSSSH